MKFSVYIANSLDGFIAREDGDVEWLNNYNQEDKTDYGFDDFISTVDIIVMGRKTFDLVAAFEGWFYQDAQLVVLSNTLTEVPEHLEDKVTIYNGGIEDLIEKFDDDFHIYVDGGSVVSQFLEKDLINEMILTTAPILLGKGIPLFSNISHEIDLDLLSSQSYSSGLIMSKYLVKR
ncbi:MAG: dihydrofolate reductase family protein [Campylobacterales bacterium]|nr:dihydrofolate reductase family protein [Campylobacterales bacterium]